MTSKTEKKTTIVLTAEDCQEIHSLLILCMAEISRQKLSTEEDEMLNTLIDTVADGR
jgi:Na+/phosphate symporter